MADPGTLGRVRSWMPLLMVPGVPTSKQTNELKVNKNISI